MKSQVATRIARTCRLTIGALALGSTPLLVLGATSSQADTLAHAARGSGSTLRITVARLPRGARARILVTGPHGVHRTLTRTASIAVAPGGYVVTAAPVSTASGTYYARASRVRVRVRAGHGRTVPVSYGTMVSNLTSVVPPASTIELSGDPSGPRTLTLAGAAAANAAQGDFLASGPTSTAPYGYLVKVTSVDHVGSTAVLQVENANLMEAVPYGEIDEQASLEPSAGAARVSLSRALESGHFSSGPIAHRASSKAIPLKVPNLECTASGSVAIVPKFAIEGPTVSFQAHWGWFLKLDSASLAVSVGEQMGLSASAGGGVECKLKKPIALLPHSIPLPDITFAVGPVPIVITPSLQVYLNGNASVSASVSASVDQQASVTVGAQYNHGSGFSPIDRFQHSFTPAVNATGDASAEVSLEPTVETLVYGVAGPSFDVGAVAKLDASVTKKPWWTLEGCLVAGFGFDFEPLHLSWDKSEILKVCKVLLKAQEGPPAGVTQPPGSGELCKRYETIGFETVCVEK